jgi:tRNA pseudouridine65 synthase
VLDIVYQDEYLVAIDKPSGLLVHRSPIDRHETRFALQLLRDQIGQRVYPVHRLDKPTSGLLLFALSPEIAAMVSSQFQNRAILKTYVAIVRGYCPQAGQIDYALKEKLDKIADKHRRAERPAQEAVTDFQCLATVELPVAVDRYPQTRYSLVRLHPLTGRRHQLRRHMKHLGHPIIGDAKHGKGVHNRFFQTQYGCNRLLLASLKMTFQHPISGDALTLHTEPGESFTRILAEFGWDDYVDPMTLSG